MQLSGERERHVEFSKQPTGCSMRDGKEKRQAGSSWHRGQALQKERKSLEEWMQTFAISNTHLHLARKKRSSGKAERICVHRKRENGARRESKIFGEKGLLTSSVIHERVQRTGGDKANDGRPSVAGGYGGTKPACRQSEGSLAA